MLSEKQMNKFTSISVQKRKLPSQEWQLGYELFLAIQLKIIIHRFHCSHWRARDHIKLLSFDSRSRECISRIWWPAVILHGMIDISRGKKDVNRNDSNFYWISTLKFVRMFRQGFRNITTGVTPWTSLFILLEISSGLITPNCVSDQYFQDNRIVHFMESQKRQPWWCVTEFEVLRVCATEQRSKAKILNR